MVRLTRQRKRASHLRVVPPQPRQLIERWSMDFVADALLDGRRFRALTVVDNYSRHSQIIEPDFTLTGMKVVAALERVAKRSGYPKLITVDNVLYLEVKRAEQPHLSCAAVAAANRRSAIPPNGASISDEALLTIVIQGPEPWPSPYSTQQAAPVEAPSIIYEVSDCLDGPSERSAPLGGVASKYGR